MRSTTVAFRGVGQVVNAYKANDMAAWAILWGGNDIAFAYEGDDIEGGADMLLETLNRLYDGGSQASFTLRVYELTGKGKILSNTPCSRSFPFKLYDDENASPYNKGRDSYAREADERIKALEAQIDILKRQIEEEEDSEAEGGINGFLAGIAADPMMKQTIMHAIAGIVQKIVPMNTARPAAVAGIDNGQQGQTLQSVLQPGQPEKVQQAINQLCTADPLLGDHLLGLAGIAMNNPGQFQWLIGMLPKS